MKLNELTLINFRRFKELNINFHPELTVIAAKNGQGKTSVLDAATVVLGTFIGAFDLGKAKHLDHNDARYHRREGLSESEQIFPVRLEAQLSNLKRRVVRELTGAKSKTGVVHRFAHYYPVIARSLRRRSNPLRHEGWIATSLGAPRNDERLG